MNEDFEIKKAWLRRYQESLREEKLLMEEIEQLREKEEKIMGKTYARDKNNQGELSDVSSQIERLIYSLRKKIEYSQNVREEVSQLIESIDLPVYKELLHRRYILGQTWEEIASHMNMTVRWLTRLHSRCVRQLKTEEECPDCK